MGRRFFPVPSAFFCFHFAVVSIGMVNFYSLLSQYLAALLRFNKYKVPRYPASLLRGGSFCTSSGWLLGYYLYHCRLPRMGGRQFQRCCPFLNARNSRGKPVSVVNKGRQSFSLRFHRCVCSSHSRPHRSSLACGGDNLDVP
jgi:hypothetical protein